MKTLIILVLLIQLLQAESYTFSGGKNNGAQEISKIILEKAYKKAGIEAHFVFTDLETSLQNSNSGVSDGEMGRIQKINKKYPNLVIVPVPITSVEAIAFSKNKKIIINSFSDLRGKKFAIIKGAKFIEYATKGYEKVYKKNFKEAMDSLDKGEVDLIVCPKLACLNIIYRYKFSDVYVVSKSLKTLKLYHFVHKKNAHLIPILTPILQKMKDDNELKYIREAYLRNLAHKKK